MDCSSHSIAVRRFFSSVRSTLSQAHTSHTHEEIVSNCTWLWCEWVGNMTEFLSYLYCDVKFFEYRKRDVMADMWLSIYRFIGMNRHYFACIRWMQTIVWHFLTHKKQKLIIHYKQCECHQDCHWWMNYYENRHRNAFHTLVCRCHVKWGIQCVSTKHPSLHISSFLLCSHPHAKCRHKITKLKSINSLTSRLRPLCILTLRLSGIMSSSIHLMRTTT